MKTKIIAAISAIQLIERANALPQGDVQQSRIDPLVAKRACRSGLEFLHSREETLVKLYPGVDMAELQSLPALCDRFGDAQRAIDSNQRVTTVASRALVADSNGWRRKLMPIADSLVASGALDADAVQKVHAGHGVVDNIRDVADLVRLLAPHRPAVDALFGPSSLVAAETAANKALEAVGLVVPSTQETRSAIDLRDRLGTLIVLWHDRLRVAVSLFTSFKQVTDIVGPLFSNARKPKEAAPVPA